MHSIFFYPESRGCGMQVVIGSRQSILSIADLLEATMIQFKVETVPGTTTSQEHMGVSGYRFWLRPEESFSG